MKVLGQLLICGMCVWLSGCITAKSPDQFRATAAGKREFVVSLPLKEAYELAAKETIRCHQGNASQMSMVGGAFFVFPTGSTRVEGKLDQDAGTATITVNFNNMVASSLLQVIDFAGADAERTNVLVYQLNDTKKWTTATASVEGWYSGKHDCYELW